MEIIEVHPEMDQEGVNHDLPHHEIITPDKTTSSELFTMLRHILKEASNVTDATAIKILNISAIREKTSLIFAKSKLAPIKGMSISRLEMLAILISIRAVKFVTQQLELNGCPITLRLDPNVH
uniref:Rad21_Rec8 domain-containing protein n=1 Tax=Loa loa TaxID=7209 RepID=A0A1I7VAV3_LOALO